MEKGCKQILKTVHVTEKSKMLEDLKLSESNPCIKKFTASKYVFLVDLDANKFQIKQAVEEAYKSQNVKVAKVNTIRLPAKKKRVRGKMKMGETSPLKKAVVTLAQGCEIDFEV